jgi:hypothetical protein
MYIRAIGSTVFMFGDAEERPFACVGRHRFPFEVGSVEWIVEPVPGRFFVSININDGGSRDGTSLWAITHRGAKRVVRSDYPSTRFVVGASGHAYRVDLEYDAKSETGPADYTWIKDLSAPAFAKKRLRGEWTVLGVCVSGSVVYGAVKRPSSDDDFAKFDARSGELEVRRLPPSYVVPTDFSSRSDGWLSWGHDGP